jgi:hypothetical protein
MNWECLASRFAHGIYVPGLEGMNIQELMIDRFTTEASDSATDYGNCMDAE